MKKSPFPGMDPYMERHWEDVHARLIGYIADALQPQLAEDLVARMEEKVYVEDQSRTLLRRPDVRVVEDPTPGEPHPGTSGTATVAEPVLLDPIGDPIRQRSVLICDAAGNRIITAIEMISPWNKRRSEGRNEYLRKRRRYLRSSVNLVEIDLVRAGNWLRMVGRYVVPQELRKTYRVTVSQPELTGPLLYSIALDARLPRITVPLRPKDAPATLDLQSLLDKAYEMGRYYRIDYMLPCDPPLVGSEKQWADELLKTVR